MTSGEEVLIDALVSQMPHGVEADGCMQPANNTFDCGVCMCVNMKQ